MSCSTPACHQTGGLKVQAMALLIPRMSTADRQLFLDKYWINIHAHVYIHTPTFTHTYVIHTDDIHILAIIILVCQRGDWALK